MWDQFSSWIAGGGISGLVLGLAWLCYRMHKDAVAAHEKRADDWKAAAQAAQARADLKEAQMGILLGRKDPVS